LSQDTTSKFKIKAFVDDDPKRVGTQINTIKIYSPKVAMTTEFIEKNRIEVMIVAIPSL
jgi:NADH/NAD ratio-sensing transcriptional regulator Rex